MPMCEVHIGHQLNHASALFCSDSFLRMYQGSAPGDYRLSLTGVATPPLPIG